MAEEAVQLIQSIQWNGSELTNVDTGALAKLHAVLLDNEAGTSMIASRSEMSTSLPQHLVSIINSPVISAKNRFVALGILVALSRTPDDHYRSQILFPVVLTLDASFEGLLTDKKDSSRQFGIAMGKPYEHLVVLLLRVTNYSLRAADILQQLCDNDDTMLSQLLLDMVRVKTYEWPLVVAILRCLHELTLPQTYFTAADSEETVQVHAFQQKVSTIVIHFMQGNTLRNFGDELTERFTTCLRQSHDVIVASLPHFAVVLKYFSGVLMNLEDFCGKPQLQKTYQQSMIVQLSSTITDCLVSFVLAAANYSPLLVSPRGPESAAMCSAIMGCLKVIRYAFYKVRILPPHLVFSLGALADIAISRLAIFRQPPLIPALLLIVETFVNVDAIIHPELGPKVQLLLAAITADTAAAGPTGATLGNTLSTLYLNEQSVFVVMENDTSRAVTGSLCSSALDDLVDEIIQYIDRELVLLGLGQAVFDFFVAPSDPQDLVFVPTPTGPEAITVGSQSSPTLVAPPAAPVSPSLVPTEVKKPKHKKRAV